MRQINKILYITNNNVYIHIENDTIVLIIDNDEKMRIPSNLIEQIIVFGNTTISSYLIKYCSDKNIILSYVSVYGNFYGRFYGKTNGNIILRKRQYELYKSTYSVEIVRNMILGKIVNSKNLLLRCNRDIDDEEKNDKIIIQVNKLSNIINQLKTAKSIDEIRGLEGSAASIYFGCFDLLLKTNDPKMLFDKRTKYPPENNFNALLSLLYTLFTTTITSALESFGLDSSLGYMHTIKPGRASLSLDLIEEFRAPIIDKFVITLINRKQITSDDFKKTGEGIHLKENSLKKVLTLWEKHKEEEIEYPLYKTKVKIKQLPYLQSQLLAQTIREDILQYPPFKWK